MGERRKIPQLAAWPSVASRDEARRGEARRGEEGGGRSPVPELPLLPHKYGFSRAVYERKRVEAREAGRA